ncbi:MAG: ferrous iron transport protein A [Clostridia bacterium]|nr:ferrous iron transport protein A [Clostridia bacterium]
MKCELSDLKIGESATIVKINITDKEIRRHLFDMGVTRGAKVKIKKIAPMGEPVDIEIRGYELALRKHEMAGIEVEK